MHTLSARQALDTCFSESTNQYSISSGVSTLEGSGIAPCTHPTRFKSDQGHTGSSWADLHY